MRVRDGDMRDVRELSESESGRESVLCFIDSKTRALVYRWQLDE